MPWNEQLHLSLEVLHFFFLRKVKVYLTMYLIEHDTIKTYGGVEVLLHTFLTISPDGKW
jgi:hypothetical protein